DAYLEAVETTLIRVRLFVPDMLVVSLGFDMVEGDPNGSFRLSSEALRPVGARIGRLGIPTIVIQEGGYNLATLGASAVSFFTGLLGL
ncbi:MAG: histone deacetylase family protein, partial [Anaerolineales bacterium]|nr:histone deacetylase family protein [Anaerolineales bacterium]